MADDDKPSMKAPVKPPSPPAPSQSEDKQPKEVWITHSFGAFEVAPEVVVGALSGVDKCSRTEAKKAIEDFLKSPASFGD